MKVVIIGGVAGGASAAARLRRLDEKAEIMVFERGEYISYANCGLPYHVGGVIEERDELLLMTPELMKDRFNIDVRVRSEVTAIDRAGKSVEVKGPDGKLYRESYDKLLIATGSSPLRPAAPSPGGPSPTAGCPRYPACPPSPSLSARPFPAYCRRGNGRSAPQACPFPSSPASWLPTAF